MKAFEAFYENEFPIYPTTERGPVGRHHKQGCAKTWRAALEEVLKHTVKDSCSLMTELRDWIRKELADETS